MRTTTKRQDRARRCHDFAKAMVRVALAGSALVLLSGCLPKRPDFMIRTERASVPLVDGTRAEIAVRVAELEQSIADGSVKGSSKDLAVRDLELLRNRLAQGDFHVGDQLIVTVSRETVTVDTATVRDQLLVSFAGLKEVSVAGLLRSEVTPRFQAHVDRYRKEFSVRVNALTRLQISGAVVRPGFYSISPDRPATELIMLAGGPTPISKLDDVTIRRDRKLIVKASQWREAARNGTTIAQLGLQPGDQIEIAAKRSVSTGQLIQLGFIAISASFAILQLLNFIYAEPE